MMSGNQPGLAPERRRRRRRGRGRGRRRRSTPL